MVQDLPRSPSSEAPVVGSVTIPVMPCTTPDLNIRAPSAILSCARQIGSSCIVGLCLGGSWLVLESLIVVVIERQLCQCLAHAFCHMSKGIEHTVHRILDQMHRPSCDTTCKLLRPMNNSFSRLIKETHNPYTHLRKILCGISHL